MRENVRAVANPEVDGLDDERTVTLNSHWPEFPYPGLRPFRITGTSDESLIFYGRNAQKDDILARLNTAHTVVVVGPSGCGKSSLIKAGVIPALEAGLLVRAGHRWRTVQMRPGRRPLVRLARAFASLLPQPNDQSVSQFEALLRLERSGCWLATDQLMPTLASGDASNWRVLLLIDQFEEIFGEQVADRDEVDQLVRLITRFFEKPHPSLYIVLTMRSDFIGHCANFQGLAEVVNASNYLIPVLKARELRQAIERPAAEYHGLVEPALVERIIADMGSGTTYHSDHLPLMQHARTPMVVAKGVPPSQPRRAAATGSRLAARGGASDARGLRGPWRNLWDPRPSCRRYPAQTSGGQRRG
jgi:energy-coupling factor transporter ATP-binding protein EcfA2